MIYNQELLEKLINEIGLYIDNDGYVKDQDLGITLEFYGKKLKLPVNNKIIISCKDNIFNPLQNIKLMKYLFNYYLQKLYKLEGRYFSIYYQVNNPNPNNFRKALHAKENSIEYKSKYYYEECLRYIDLILTIGGYNIDLTKFDHKKVI